MEPVLRDGMQVIEGNPVDGLAWRLWLPTHASASERLRLAVWLHPSRDSGEVIIEPLAPLLAKHGYALLVPLKNDYHGWTSTEIKALFGQTIPHVALRPDVDAQLPLLIGFSAGGQMALHLWHKAPEALGAVVLIGTLPALVSDGVKQPVIIPAREQVLGTAVLSLVGENERGAADWVRVAPDWLAAGVPLTLQIVSARSHEWLIGPRETVLFETWLETISESSTALR